MVETAERARDEAQRMRRLLAHHAVSSALASSTTLDEAAPRILDAVCDSLGWDIGVLWRVDDAAGLIRCVEVRCPGGFGFTDFAETARRMAFPPGRGFPGQIWSNREPNWIEDVRLDPGFLRAQVAAQDGLRSVVGFPVVVRDRVLGVVEFLAGEIRPPDEELLKMMGAIGSQVGQFIERTEAEAAVRESEARKSAMLESALDCVIAIDHEGRVTEFNPAAERTFGYPRERAIGERMVELIVPPALREAHLAGFARYLTSGETNVLGRLVEMPAQRADGSEFPVELAITRVPLAGPPVFTAYVRDISERGRREDELRRSQELYRLVVENTKDMITLIDPQGVVLFASPSWADVLGYPPESLPGVNALELVHPVDLETAEAAIAACLSGGRAAVAAVRLRHADGSWRVLEGVVSGIHDEAGKSTMILATSRDVTEREQAERAREQRERAEREFVVNAAHELRTPLAAISAAVDVLEAGAKHVPEERDSFLADVGREAGRMQRLVHALLVLARVQTLHESLLREPVELRQLLVESADAVVPAAEVEVEVVCPPGLTFLAERTILETALSNLGANAAAHTERGRITFTGAAGQSGSVQIEVSDTGCGMSLEEADRAFDRFYRVGKRDARGFGLGLAIVRQAVEVHDGSLGIETAPGAGTAVRITLPAAQWAEQ